MMSLHHHNAVAKRCSIALNIFLAVRTAMIQVTVDRVAGDLFQWCSRNAQVPAVP